MKTKSERKVNWLAILVTLTILGWVAFVLVAFGGLT